MDRLDHLVGDLRDRTPRAMSQVERRVVGALAGAYVAAAVSIGFLVPWEGNIDPLLVIGLVALFAGVSRVGFEVGSIIAVATQLVFVPMLFLVPLPLVLILVPVAYLLATVPDILERETHADRWMYALCDSWFAVGPVVVFALADAGAPRVEDIDIYVLALLAQFATETIPEAFRERVVRGLSFAQNLGAAVWIYRIDAILSPIGFMAAFVAAEEPLMLIGILPLVWLLHAFARERKERYSAAIELNRAYQGTVMLLSDVVEADDNYTADHCRSVVGLVNDTADELGIQPETRQELEFAALLHDVGKIVIPKEILNKPGALTDEEFDLMKTHTLEGQVLLNRVGGLLGRVGQIVRSCHERWDGTGYPDGLSGYDIPLEARIVFTCDAYSAMTTDRPYRAAMSQETALEELWANAGTQFDPRVVAALAQVVKDSPGIGYAPDDAVRETLVAELPGRLNGAGRS